MQPLTKVLSLGIVIIVLGIFIAACASTVYSGAGIDDDDLRYIMIDGMQCIEFTPGISLSNLVISCNWEAWDGSYDRKVEAIRFED